VKNVFLVWVVGVLLSIPIFVMLVLLRGIDNNLYYLTVRAFSFFLAFIGIVGFVLSMYYFYKFHKSNSDKTQKKIC